MEVDPDFLRDVAIGRGALLSAAAAAVISLAAAVGFGLLAGPGIRKLFRSERSRDRRIWAMVPLRAVLEDGRTIVCEDGRLAQVIEVDGADIGSMGRDAINVLDRNREALFRQVQDEMSNRGDPSAYEIKFFFERARRGRLRELAWPEDQPLMAAISERWRARFQARFETRFFIVISVAGRVNQARERLEELYRAVKNTLSSFRPRRLGRKEQDGPSEPIAFWNRWLNGGLGAELAVSEALDGGGAAKDGTLHRVLGGVEIVMNAPKTGMITFEDGTRKRYCRALEIRQFPGTVHKQPALDLMSLDCECRVLLQTRITTPSELQKEVAVRGMLSGKRLKPDTAEELDAIAEERSLTWAETRLTIFVFADHEQRLNQDIDRIRAKLSNSHFVDTGVIGAGIELVWQALFPGRQWIETKSYLASPVLAEFTAMFRSDRGFEHCDFGEGPVTVFPTLTGDLYRFVYHASAEPEAPGHTVVVGGTGTGKTFLIEYLVGMSLRYPKLRSFLFDAGLGTYVFTNAVGGRYWSLAHGEDAEGDSASLNLLRLPPNAANREFLKRWIAILADLDALKETDRAAYTAAMGDIVTAVDKLASTAVERRSLAGIFSGSFKANPYLADALEEWVDAQANGRIFNGRTDSLDLSEGRVVSFDMTDMKDNEKLLRALIPYLIYRIRRSVLENGSPYLLVFEETSHMLRVPALATFLKEELQQARKRHGVVVMAFQEPSTIERSDAADEILNNTYTQIFFPNPSADLAHYEAFNLQPHEFTFIKGGGEAFRHLRRPVLIRKRTQTEGFTSVVVETDLSIRLDADTLRLFKSGSDYADLCRSALKTYGPDGWIGPYQDLAARMEREKRPVGSGEGRARRDPLEA